MEFRMNDKAKFVTGILKDYADSEGVILRSTSDLSPLETWLLMKMYNSTIDNETKKYTKGMPVLNIKKVKFTDEQYAAIKKHNKLKKIVGNQRKT